MEAGSNARREGFQGSRAFLDASLLLPKPTSRSCRCSSERRCSARRWRRSNSSSRLRARPTGIKQPPVRRSRRSSRASSCRSVISSLDTSVSDEIFGIEQAVGQDCSRDLQRDPIPPFQYHRPFSRTLSGKALPVPRECCPFPRIDMCVGGVLNRMSCCGHTWQGRTCRRSAGIAAVWKCLMLFLKDS